MRSEFRRRQILHRKIIRRSAILRNSLTNCAPITSRKRQTPPLSVLAKGRILSRDRPGSSGVPQTRHLHKNRRRTSRFIGSTTPPRIDIAQTPQTTHRLPDPFSRAAAHDQMPLSGCSPHRWSARKPSRGFFWRRYRQHQFFILPLPMHGDDTERRRIACFHGSEIADNRRLNDNLLRRIARRSKRMPARY